MFLQDEGATPAAGGDATEENVPAEGAAPAGDDGNAGM